MILPVPGLPKILGENFWSQENVPDHRDSGRTGNSSLKILIRLGVLTPGFPKPPPGGLARGHDLWPLTYHIPCAKSSFAHALPEACIRRRLAIPCHSRVVPLHSMCNVHAQRHSHMPVWHLAQVAPTSVVKLYCGTALRGPRASVQKAARHSSCHHRLARESVASFGDRHANRALPELSPPS